MDIIGVDAGGTWIKSTRFSSDLTELKTVKVRSGSGEGKEAYFDSIAQSVRELGVTKESAAAGEVAVGLSLPAVLSKNRQTIHYMTNVKGIEIGDSPFTIQEALAERIGTEQLFAENDAGCAALAEWGRGLGKADPAQYLLHLTWGTGIGTGMVVDGASQFGWEGGHLPVTWAAESEFNCNCGSRTDLEALIAAPRLIDRAETWWQEKKYATQLTEAAFVDRAETTKVLVELAEAGDELAVALFREALTWMARGLHTMAILSYPDIVTIGGGIMASDWLLTELREAVGREATGLLADTLRPEQVHQAQLGNKAGMVGAAVLAQRLLSE